MTGSTPNFAFPYPEGSDKVATHTDIRTLANAIDSYEKAAADDVEAAVDGIDAKYSSLLAAIQIGGTQHLNTLITPGQYRTIASKTAGDTSLGYPQGAVHGVLNVVTVAVVGGQPYVLQTWLDTWNMWVARRRLYAGNWTDWVRDPSLPVVEGLINPIADRVSALEDTATGATGVQALRFRPVTSDFRPDAFASPEGTVCYWTGPTGVERIPWGYRGEGYVGRIGQAAGYTTMMVTKVQENSEIEVSCLNPDSGRHITHRVQGSGGSTGADDQRRFEEAWIGDYNGTTIEKDLMILPRSNIEWAFQIDVDGNKQFAPYHGATSCRATQYGPASITDALGHSLGLDALAVGGVVENVPGVKVRQRLYLTHPDSGDTHWAAVDEVRTIAPDGMIQSEAVITFLRDTKIGNAYAPMTPVDHSTFDQVHVLEGGTYPVATTPPAVTEYVTITEGHAATSTLFTSTDRPDAFVATAFLDPGETLARGDSMEEQPPGAMKFEQRSSGLTKVYPVPFASGSVIPAGTVWRPGAQWRYGETTDPGQYA